MLTNDGDSSPPQISSSSSLGSINTTTVINGPISSKSNIVSSQHQQITGVPHSAIIRNNISVTNIKCEDNSIINGLLTNPISSSLSSSSSSTTITPISTVANNYYNGIVEDATTTTTASTNSGVIGGSIRIAVPKVEESDDESESELSNIENLKVSRRSNNKNNGPRPMSWEGELSENENELMETDQNHQHHHNHHINNNNNISNNNNINNNNHQHHHHHHHNHFPPMCIIKEEPKSLNDYDSINLSQSITNASCGSSLLSPINASNKKLQPQNEILNLKYEPGTTNFIDNLSTTAGPGGGGSGGGNSGVNSPLLARSKIQSTLLPANPSPDSAIHSVYTHSSPSQSPLTSRHAPYTPSLSRNNSDASHSSCYSYSSEFSPTHSPIQGRHNIYGGNGTSTSSSSAAATAAINSNNGQTFMHSILYRPIHENLDNNGQHQQHQQQQQAQLFVKKQEQLGISTSQQLNSNSSSNSANCNSLQSNDVLLDNESGIPSPGISRQQLINSPCPICGDKISGFHYGIFSCESCKGFFKRTVQNRKNYICVRGGPCPVTIATRKKCPACRFDKCLNKGMKLEAIREDRTRGGRSTYQCSYTLPNPLIMSENTAANLLQANARMNGCVINSEASSDSNSIGGNSSSQRSNPVPQLLQEIMDVEHLWQYNEAELTRLNQPVSGSGSSATTSSLTTDRNAPSTSTGINSAAPNITSNPLLASAGLSSDGENTNPDLIATLCNVADLRLLKIVKWCKSLPLFKNISIDDQICLLINSWCELLLFSCCFRSLSSPGEIKISLGKTITLTQAKTNGLQACIERMLNLTEHLRRLRVDRYEYVAMKVIVLLQSDTTELREPVKVRENQEKALQALQAYTLSHYPENRSKFGELLLRIPELQRTCQLVKEMLLIKSKDGEDFNLLMELLRGEH